MNDEIKPESDAPAESALIGVSVRAWLATIMTVTVCIMSAWSLTVTEPLYSGFLFGIGFYLGQKTKQP
jgi:hypothetical protein